MVKLGDTVTESPNPVDANDLANKGHVDAKKGAAFTGGYSTVSSGQTGVERTNTNTWRLVIIYDESNNSSSITIFADPTEITEDFTERVAVGNAQFHKNELFAWIPPNWKYTVKINAGSITKWSEINA